MKKIIEILLNSLPEAIGGLLAAGIIALLSYFFVKRLKKESPPINLANNLLPETKVPPIYSNLPSERNSLAEQKKSSE